MDDAVIWASHIFFIFSYNFFFPVATVLNTSDTIKYQYPPPPNPMKSSMHPLIISSVPLICLVCRPDSLSLNPGHICNLFWKITHTFCPVFSVPLFHISLHQDILFQSQRMRKHWQLEFNYFYLSLFQCAGHLNNCSKTVIKYHAPTPSHKRKHKVTIGNKEKNLECGHFVICRNNFVWIRK